jgi:hypothetical protein
VPRNVVTVFPRWFPPLPSRRREQQRILAEITRRHRPTPHEGGDWLHLDFSKREDAAAVQARVVTWLDEINPAWRRYVNVYSAAERQAS